MTDLERLIEAADRAVKKGKIEYDRVAAAVHGEQPPADESWAEFEALDDAAEAMREAPPSIQERARRHLEAMQRGGG